MKIAALITVHNRKDKTLACLSGLYAQQIPGNCALEVYLTDDGCTDGTSDAVREQFPRVHIVAGNGNLYWNRGMHTAWEAASNAGSHDAYLWLNDDTLLFDGAVKTLIACAETFHNEAIIVGATVDAATHTKLTYGGHIGNNITVPDGHVREVDYFNGNIVLVPGKVYEKLGNLDWYFTHSKGDFDYGLRAKMHGIKLYQAAVPLGECDAHVSLDKWCNPQVPLSERWRMLHRPNGMPPKETFHLERRHYGLLRASFHFVTVYLRCLFPQIWIMK